MAIRRLIVRDKYCPPNMHPLTIDDATGIRVYYEDLPGDEVRLVTVQPVDEIIEQNALDRYDAKGTFTRKGKWGALAARVPLQELEKWKHHACGDRLDPDDQAKALKQKLNDSDNAKWRVGEFRV